MLRTSSGLIMYSGSMSAEANCEGELNPDKASELELVVEEVWAARDEEERDTSRQAVTRLLQSFFSGLHVAPDSIISVRLAILPRKNYSNTSTRAVLISARALRLCRHCLS